MATDFSIININFQKQNIMKQKLLSLLTLLVLCVTGAWAQTTYTYTGYTSQIANGWTHDYGNTYVGRKGSNYTPENGGLPTGNGNIFAAFQVNATSKIKVVFVWTKTNGDLSGKQIDLATLTETNYNKLVTASTGTGNDVKYSIDNFSSSQHVAVAINRSNANTEQEFEFENTVNAGYYAVYTASSINASALIKKIIVTPAAPVQTYAITWANGGHGTAPDSPTSASTFTLPTMTADGYTNTGWTANQDVTVSGNSVSVGTEIAVGTSVTLTAATTFTGVWKANSTFALESDEEVEVAVDGTSNITYLNNAGTVTYASADESIATVDADGVITGVAGGKTTITVTDPGSAAVAGGSATVTVLVPYPNPAAADSYVLDNAQYGFSNTANTKWYFKNGFVMSIDPSAGYSSSTLDDGTKGIKIPVRDYTLYTLLPSGEQCSERTIPPRHCLGQRRLLLRKTSK